MRLLAESASDSLLGGRLSDVEWGYAPDNKLLLIRLRSELAEVRAWLLINL